jgi:YidC/Oxa1 family membrane protein insertase
MDAILAPIMWVVAWVMYGSHQVITFFGNSSTPGWAWVMSIVILTFLMRAAMIPLFFKQIKSSRAMQLLQPEMQAIQKKYKGKTDQASREAMAREQMELYKKHKTNPFSSCLPMLLQSPVFFALFRVLNTLPNVAAGEGNTAMHLGREIVGRGPIGPIDAPVAEAIQSSTLFGARMSDVFMQLDHWGIERIVVIVLIVLMSATMFFTQRQLTMKNMPQSALEGPMASTQKMMLYGMPLIFVFSGINFPVGVLIYWVVTNLWSMGQQYYTIKRMPVPGSAADKALKEKRARKAAEKGIELTPEQEKIVNPQIGQRQQPVRKNRAKKG